MAELRQALAPLHKRFVQTVQHAGGVTNEAQDLSQRLAHIHGKFPDSRLEELASRVEGIAAQLRNSMNGLKEALGDIDDVMKNP